MPLQRRDRIVLAVESTKTVIDHATTFTMAPWAIINADGRTHSYGVETYFGVDKSFYFTEYHPTLTIDLPNPTGTMFVQ